MLNVLQWRLDAWLLTLLGAAAFAGTELWLRRRGRSRGLPGSVFVLGLGLLAMAWFLAEWSAFHERDRLRRMIAGLAPTYALEIQRLGHASLSLGTSSNDPVYLGLVQRQMDWLRANPAVSDIYTMRQLPDGKVVFVVDSETDYDHNGKFEGEKEARTPIGEV